jgi:toxin secretion/phage lysis holin
MDVEKVVDNCIKWGAAVAGLVTGWYGGWTQGTRVLVALMVIDYVLGCVCALTGHSVKTKSGHFLTSVAFMGLLKKAVIMLVILVAVQLDKALGHGEGVMFRSAAEFFYIATEGLSIVENAGLLGVPIPRFLRQALEALREEHDGKKDEERKEDEDGEE